MVLYAIFIIAAIFIFITIGRDNIMGKFGMVIFSCFMSLITTFISAFVIFMTAYHLGQYKEIDIYYQNIISMRNNSKTEGSFFLGSGSINQVEYYFYFYKTKDGGIKRDKVSTRYATIHETNDKSPRVEWTMVTKAWPWWLKIYKSMSDIERLGDFRVYVPEGTIIERFELN